MLTRRMQIQAIADRLAGLEVQAQIKDFEMPWQLCWQAVVGAQPGQEQEALHQVVSGLPEPKQILETILATRPGYLPEIPSLEDIAPGLPPIEWVWDGWIPRGLLTVLGASQPLEVELIEGPEGASSGSVGRQPGSVSIGWGEGRIDTLEAPSFPDDVGLPGSRTIPLGGRVFIEREDFAATPPKKWKRLAPGLAVRLRYGPVVRCDEVVHDAEGRVVKLRCAVVDAASAAINGTIHWVPAHAAVRVEVRLYDRLFAVEKPDADASGRDWLELLNPESCTVVADALVEPAAGALGGGVHVQLERTGFFFTDPKDSKPGAPVFNRVVTLRDGWARLAAAEAGPPVAAAAEAPTAVDPAKASKKSKADLRVAAHATDALLAGRHAALLAVGIAADDADLLSVDPDAAALLETARAVWDNPAVLGRWIVNEVQALAKEGGFAALKLTGPALAQLAQMVDGGALSNLAGKEVLLAVVSTGAAPAEIVEQRGLRQVNDVEALRPLVAEVIAAHPDHVARYKAGNAGLLGFLTGQIVRKSGGKANPQSVQSLLRELLSV